MTWPRFIGGSFDGETAEPTEAFGRDPYLAYSQQSASPFHMEHYIPLKNYEDEWAWLVFIPREVALAMESPAVREAVREAAK